MKQLVIVGAGDFGRELLHWVQSSPRFLAAHEIVNIGFLDDGPISKSPGAPVVGPINGHKPSSSSIYLCSIGSPAVRERIVSKLIGDGASFVSFTHDSVIVGSRVSVGEGSIICPGNILTVDITIGKHVHLNLSCMVGHDVVIEDYVSLSPSCNLTGGVVIEQGAFLGTAVSVIPGKRVGAGSRIGAGSLVLRKIPPGVTAFGNPCRTLGPAS